MAELEISGVGLKLDERDILKAVSVAVPAGKIGALLGPDGSGKTSLLRAVAGLAQPHAGTIRIGERVLYDAATKVSLPPNKRGTGLIFDSYALWPHWSVFENVAFCVRLRGAAKDEIKSRTDKMLEQVELADLAGREPAQLSDLEQLRLALARAVASEPTALLLDEPLARLDAGLRRDALAWLKRFLLKLGIPVLVATRDPIESMAIAERIALINAGAIEQEGTPNDLYALPATAFVANFMGENNRIEGTIVENSGQRAVIEVMGNRISGHSRSRAASGEPATAVIRVERMQLGGGPGPNRIQMRLSTQLCLGERWELNFVKDALTVRAYTSGPLRHELYHVEFPFDALLIF